MAFTNNAIQFEIIANGLPTNGGGFRFNAVSGVDYTRSVSPYLSFSDLQIHPVNNTWVRSAANPITTDCNGNIINITSGAGWTTGIYEIQTITLSGYAVLSSSPAATNTSGGNGNLGGALNSLGTAMGFNGLPTGSIFWLNGSSGNFFHGPVVLGLSITPSASTLLPNRIIGYTNSRGDTGIARIVPSGITQGTSGYLNFTGGGWDIRNIFVDQSSGIGTFGTNCSLVKVNTARMEFIRCKLYTGNTNAPTYGLDIKGAQTVVTECEFSGGFSTAQANLQSVSTAFYRSIFYNGIRGITATTAPLIANKCIFWGLTTAGINLVSPFDVLSVVGNIFYACQQGIFNNNPPFFYGHIKDNLFINNTQYGMKASSANGRYANYNAEGNFYYGNTSGPRFGIDDGDGNFSNIWDLNSGYLYSRLYDVNLQGTPFINGDGGNFALNDISLQGGLVRSSGDLSVMPIFFAPSYADGGPFQTRNIIRYVGMGGGF